MPKPYKLHAVRPLPAAAEIVDHEGIPHVRLRERGKPVLYRLTRDGTKYLRPSKRWYFDVRDHNGTVRRVKGFTDLKATEQLAAEMERKAARVRAGILDPHEDQLRRPLADHLTDYAAALEAKGNTADHTRQTVARVSALLTGCGFVFSADVDAAKVSAWLIDLRRDSVAAAIPAGDAFTPAETAKLLGISGAAIRAAVKRLGLPATGHGKARSFPAPPSRRWCSNDRRGAGRRQSTTTSAPSARSSAG